MTFLNGLSGVNFIYQSLVRHILSASSLSRVFAEITVTRYDKSVPMDQMRVDVIGPCGGPSAGPDATLMALHQDGGRLISLVM